jgi:hypothetical protein
MPQPTERHADVPQPPAATPALHQALADQAAYRGTRALLQRRSATRALILLGMIVLLASIARAGIHRVFLPGWWRHW